MSGIYWRRAGLGAVLLFWTGCAMTWVRADGSSTDEQRRATDLEECRSLAENGVTHFYSEKNGKVIHDERATRDLSPGMRRRLVDGAIHTCMRRRGYVQAYE